MGKRYPLYTTIKMQREKWFPHYKYISQAKNHHALLESGRGGQYTIMGLDPVAILKGKNNKLEIFCNNESQIMDGNPLHLMREWMNDYKTEKDPTLPDFQGGAIGYISYDYARYIESLPEIAKDDLYVPDVYFMVFNDVFIYDHKQEELYIITHYTKGKLESAKEHLHALEMLWKETKDVKDSNKGETIQESDSDLQVSLTELEFQSAVERIKEYIGQGDIFQVNLSVRQSQRLKVNPLEVYSCLREINPSPYMAFLQDPEFQIVSGSPELLIKKSDAEVSTRPIAGTRSRGINEQEDERLAKELIENEKERAEHVMLVDLERNDLGRVCEYGSVEVNEFMVIERYSHVMHIVSNVRGTMSKQYDAYSVIDAVFPGGTITGAPKIRTMEIIEELEPVRRGLYTGSIGWIGFNGDMELNIAIRTMTVHNGHAYIQAGAGVVIDSNPEAEYKESLKKAKALWKAKEVAEETKLKEKVE
ncbi:aminodeoxychorismate synthase component I [Bacillus salitolerans]|uniref:aminodeoxychorismate synthase n=1 Tax=Bacillus salitolerans TaxID=1437434 RepID=A0ABW4LPD8_9BACI